MSVIIRLQNLPWSANALDIRNFFRGLSIPEGGVHIVGGELGDAFIAFSTDEDARQAMMLDGGKIKEIQVKLLLSSRSEMHKVIEAARQSVPILTLTAPAPVVTPTPASVPAPIQPPVTTVTGVTPFSAVLGNTASLFGGIPGIGNPQEIPQPAVIEPPVPLGSPTANSIDAEKEDEKSEAKRNRDRRRSQSRSRTRSRSRSRDRNRKSKRERRDRSRSRERRRRDRSRSRERRDRKRDRKDRSRSRDRSPRRNRRSETSATRDRKSPQNQTNEKLLDVIPTAPPSLAFGKNPIIQKQMPQMVNNPQIPEGPMQIKTDVVSNRFDSGVNDTLNKIEEVGKKRNPNAFQTEQNGGKFQGGRGGVARGGHFRREGRASRFESEQRDCCVAIRNAPNHTSYGDVRRFFPFLIDKHGIKMINDSMGRRTGNIFVRFCDTRSKHLALQSKLNELKGAQVTVEHLDDEAYMQAVDSFLPYREDNDEEDPDLIIANSEPLFSVLKLSDLPNFVKEHDIIKMFSDFSLLSIILTNCRMTRTKTAFVQFVKSEDAKLAFNRKDHFLINRRNPTITIVNDKEYEQEKLEIENSHELGRNERTVDNEPQPESEPVKPRDPRQRRQHFDNGPTQAPNVVPPTHQQQQAPGGGPYFSTPFMQQPNFPVQNQFPPQFPTGFPGPGAVDPRTAAANWATRPGFPNPINQIQVPPPLKHPTPNQMDDEPLNCVLMKGLPSEATDRTIVNFLSDTEAVPARIHLMLDTNGMPSGDCFCEFRSTQEARQAATKHGHNLDGFRVTVDLVARSVVEDALEGPKQGDPCDSIPSNGPPQQPMYYDIQRGGFGGPRAPFRGRGGFDRGNFNSRGGFDQSRGSFRARGDRGSRGRGGFDRGGYERGRGRGFSRGRGGFDSGRDRNEDDDAALEDFGAPGCVVSMDNVPFRATVDDIMNFFSDFDLTQDDIIRRYNERGQATGDARVAFRTPFDAQRAAKIRNMDMIFDRRINLSII